MTGQEYFEGLGHPPEEAKRLAAASRREYAGQLREAARMVERGCIYVDPDTASEQ